MNDVSQNIDKGAENKPLIEIKDLCKTFVSARGNVEALKNISVSINSGDIFGIIGMSGAGKSTLVRCMNFLEKPTSGSVVFDGKDLSSMDAKQMRDARHSIGMIFQQFNLLAQKTALKNICFPLEIMGVDRQTAEKRARELLEIVGLSDREGAYPSQLSGGQKQRVAIARALATSPKVLLCDEATSALDPTTTRAILKLLKDINGRLGVTIVIITHEMSVIEEICSHVAIISDGEIAETGRVSDIFAQPGTKAGRELVYPEGHKQMRMDGKRMLRIVFDGSSSYEPVISSMILECKTQVNIMFADMRDIDGIARGQMVIQLPEDELFANRVIAYLKDRDLAVEEVVDSD